MHKYRISLRPRQVLETEKESVTEDSCSEIPEILNTEIVHHIVAQDPEVRSEDVTVHQETDVTSLRGTEEIIAMAPDHLEDTTTDAEKSKFKL